jgi:hypothetical protein
LMLDVHALAAVISDVGLDAFLGLSRIQLRQPGTWSGGADAYVGGP